MYCQCDTNYQQFQNCGCVRKSNLRSFVLVPQQVTTTVSQINIGCPQFICGKAIIPYDTNTLIFKCPGLYCVNIAGDFTITDVSDHITIQPTINGNDIVGSQLYVSNISVGVPTAFTKSFYVAVNEPSELQFNQTGSDTSDIINTFAVTVLKV